jgi:hypothetical protein
MDCRVKPGNDAAIALSRARCGIFAMPSIADMPLRRTGTPIS